jgi:2-hydroxychromene-2-carboxylate isomerase
MARFLYDYGSPNAYLAWRVLPAIEERTREPFERVPVLLGGIFKATGNQSPFYAFAGVKGRLDYERLEMERFCERHGITEFRFNPHFPQNSLQMMRGAVAARGMSLGERYDALIFRGLWELELKLDEAEALSSYLGEHGLDADALVGATGEPAIKAELIARTDQAVEQGVFGLPSFFVGDELYFGKDRLDAVEDAIRRRSSAG